MVFGRGRKAKQEQLTEPGETREADAPRKARPDRPGRRPAAPPGPFDVSEIENQDGYVDLGALLIAPREGLQLRLEVEEATQRVVAVTMDLDGSSLQLQAFAAPRSEGLWDEIREQIGQSVGSQGGQVEEIQGPFGTELVAKLPAGGADGSQGYRVARFIGVDGPRWFLRGVLGGDAALDRDAAAALEDLFRQIVVVRGESPMPPRDLLQLRLPKDSNAAAPPPPDQGRPPTRAARTWTGDNPDWLMPPARTRRLRSPSGGCRSAAGCCATASSNRSPMRRPARWRVHAIVVDHDAPPARNRARPRGRIRRTPAGQPRPVPAQRPGPRPAARGLAGPAPIPGIDAGTELRLEGMVTSVTGCPPCSIPATKYSPARRSNDRARTSRAWLRGTSMTRPAHGGPARRGLRGEGRTAPLQQRQHRRPQERRRRPGHRREHPAGSCLPDRLHNHA